MLRNESYTLREVNVAENLRRGTRVTGADRSRLAADLSKRYGTGESIRTLAASTGRSYGFVHRILTETGVTLRGRGGASRTPGAPRTPGASKQSAAKK
jgi:Helix-turn-helix domain